MGELSRAWSRSPAPLTLSGAAPLMLHYPTFAVSRRQTGVKYLDQTLVCRPEMRNAVSGRTHRPELLEGMLTQLVGGMLLSSWQACSVAPPVHPSTSSGRMTSTKLGEHACNELGTFTD